MGKRRGVGGLLLRSAGVSLVGLSLPWLMWLFEPHHQPWKWEVGESLVFLCGFNLIVAVAAVRRARRSAE
jgi:hypothetical protein